MSKDDVLFALNKAVELKAEEVSIEFKTSNSSAHIVLNEAQVAENIAHFETHPDSRMIIETCVDSIHFYNIYEVSRLHFNY